MPRGDGTGPGGQGSMTGRGMGYCAGYNSPGYMNGGYGQGRGFGRGRGLGYGPAVDPSLCSNFQPVDEKKMLESEMEAIKKRLGELESDK